MFTNNNEKIKGGERKMMKRIRLMLLISVIGLFCMAGRSEATLLGVDLYLPDILSDTTGVYSYNASTDILSFSATALTITFDGTTIIPITSGSYSAKFQVDSSGNFVSGVSGDDLVITGSFSYGGNSYSGTLVSGEVTAFGWTVPGTPFALFDYTFDFTSGALSSFYAVYNNHGADIALSEVSDFNGDWTVTHSGIKTKHDTAPATPEPTSLFLLGSSLLGMAAFARKKRKR